MLTDQIALITGASRGIGRAIAEALGGEQATVIGTATSQGGADSITAALSAAGIKGTGMVLDVASPESINDCIKQVTANYGAPDILVNNAGITRDTLLMMMKDEQWNDILETNSEKLLQIILIGQPELAQMLAQPELRQLNQRITARYNLEPLNLDETGAYIHHRLQVAGMSPDRVIFPTSVVRGIYQRTRGIPRVINVLCDRILLGAYGRNKTRADRSMLKLATREVLGEVPSASADWRWPTAIAAVLLAAMGSWWFLQEFARPPVASVALERSPVTPQFKAPVPDMASGPEPVSAPAIPRQEMPVAMQEIEAETERVQPGASSDWLLPPAVALSQLWTLYSDNLEPESLCAAQVQSDVSCIEGKASTWDDLLKFDRPLLLEMITPARFAAAVLLLGMDGRSAWVLTPRGVSETSLVELGPLWTGRYRFLWHPPRGFDGPIALGDDSPVVTEVAGLFARLDGQQRALAGSRFNAALQQRVRLFQLEQNLEDDGVVGVYTLLALNEQVGIDTTAAQARSQLQRESTVEALR
jgi:general secretion pathway protein A